MLYWFQQLSARERFIVAAGAIALVIILGYILFLEPFMTAHSQLKNRVLAQKNTLEWMQMTAIEVQRLRHQSSQTPFNSVNKISLLSIVDKSTRIGSLAKINKRIEPKGRQKVQVRFESIEFTELILWLANLYNVYAVQVTKINIENSNQVGVVKTNLTLEMGF
ncbi:MAG: type II secretion system protein M [Thiomargarita sp.]|nr:type II secretion system protein M [Thiomargarita sp.]